jgi:hypothetical protein
LFFCALPHGGIFGFVPYFPVFNPVFETVCPAFIVMAYDVFANSCPFCKIFRWIDIIGTDFVEKVDFDLKAERFNLKNYDNLVDNRA